MKQKREGGSVPIFIVVAVVLIGLLLGGAYFVQQQSHNKPASTASPTPEEQKGGTEQKPIEGATPSPAGNGSQTNTSSAQTSPDQSSHTLPQTGPANTLITILALGLLTGAIASYLQSRRQLAPL